jgi:peptidoglycan/xylan/chitin deacetylase (PgdA/CDA1 family)
MENSKPMVALTFDDGPSEHTHRLLDALEKNNAVASFFVVGIRVEAGKNIVKRAFDLGNEVIPHTWTDPDLTTLSSDEIKKELLDTEKIIRDITGTCPSMYRPPYGSFNDTSQKASADIGYPIINWSIDPMDWECLCADTVFNHVMENIHDNAIVLSHDLWPTTVDAYERLIPELQKKYELVTVSELMRRCCVDLEPGVVYTNG